MFWVFFSVGRQTVEENIPEMYKIQNDLRIRNGGAWNPATCVSRSRVAIIIPFRDRLAHLLTSVYHLHKILQRQLLEYRIFVVEQVIFFLIEKVEHCARSVPAAHSDEAKAQQLHGP